MYLASEPSRLCGYTLFLAELFTQLVTSTGHPLEVLRSALCQLLSTLLSQPTDANLKCVAQVLKVRAGVVLCIALDVLLTVGV